MADCEEAEWALPAQPGMRVLASLTDDDHGERVVLNVMSSVGSSEYRTTATGELVHAISVSGGVLEFQAVHADRFTTGLFVAAPATGVLSAVLTGVIGGSDLTVWMPPPGEVHNVALGARRLVYRVPFSGARSLDATTGGDYRVLTSESTGVLDVYLFDKLSPERFLFEAILPLATAPSGTTRTILVGDGIEPPVPWLAPEDQGDDATVRFAGTHVAWLRGYGQKQLNIYETVETWAADLDLAGDPVAPRKIEDFPGINNATSAVASRGRIAAVAAIDRVRLCDLASSECRDMLLPPNGGELSRLVGLTATHLWIETSGQKRMFRLKP